MGNSYRLNNGMRWNPLKEWPRNSPCFCGSKRKAKKCHLPNVGPVCNASDYDKLRQLVDMVKAGVPVDITFRESRNQAETPEPIESIDHG